MAWAEAYAEKQSGLQGLIGQVQQQNQAEEQQRGSRAGGLLGLIGGALTMLIPGGQVAGIGMMVGGASRLAGG